MGVIIRQGFKSTVVSYVGVLIGALNQLVLATEFLSPEEIGLREILLSSAMGLTILAQLGIQYVMSRYFVYFEDNTRQHNGFLLLSLLVGAAGTLICGLLFSLFKPDFLRLFRADIGLVGDFVWLIMPLTGLLVLHAILETWARLHLRIVANALARELLLRLCQTLLMLAYGMGFISFHWFVFGFVASYGLAIFFLVAYLVYDNRLYLKPSFLKIPAGLGKEMIKYAVWVMIGGAGYIVAERIDGVMLASLVSLKQTGIYAISFFIASLIEMPRRAISQLSSTIVARYWKEQDFGSMQKLYQQVSLNQLLLGGLLFLLIWTSIDGLFLLMPNGHIYAQGKYVVLFIGLSRVIDMFFGINNEIILNSPYYKFSLISILFLAVISFLANYIMIPLYGISGAATGTILSMLLYNLLKSGFIKNRFHLKLISRQSLSAMAVITLLLLLGFLIPFKNTSTFWIFIEIGIRSMMVAVIYIGVIYKFHLSPDIQVYLLKAHAFTKQLQKKT
jgi:O-antigen/teichoic acid export membrane protein